MEKPKSYLGYTEEATALCEQTLLTLIRGLGPLKDSVFLAGGLVPRFLVDQEAAPGTPQHIGTQDVDLVLDLNLVADIEAYRTLEENLKNMGFARSLHDDGRPRHFAWIKEIVPGVSVRVDLLSEVPDQSGGTVIKIETEHRLSALNMPGCAFVMIDHKEVEIKGEQLDGLGWTKERIRVAAIASFLVLKGLALEHRNEPKDAYDIVYCLLYYPGGVYAAANEFRELMEKFPADERIRKALDSLRSRFASEPDVRGERKDGPVSYARFVAPAGDSDEVARRRLEAFGVVSEFLRVVDA
jgi:hypothetical protein